MSTARPTTHVFAFRPLDETRICTQLVIHIRFGSCSDEVCHDIAGCLCGAGHRIGATGAVLTAKLIRSMRRDGPTHGLVTLCIGGGQGTALAIEAVH
jgi:acetyl-CoA acetyltransferase